MWWVIAATAQSYNIAEYDFHLPAEAPVVWENEVRQQLRRGLELSRRVRGADDVPIKARSLSELGEPLLMAIYLVRRGRLPPGVEYDLVLGEGSDRRAATLWVKGRSTIAVSTGERVRRLEAGPAISRVVKAHGLAGWREEGARFGSNGRALLHEALGILSDRERAGLADVTIVRVDGEGPHTNPFWTTTAQYLWSSDAAAEIRIFDGLLRDPERFVGPVDAPRHPGLMMVLHEVAHAIDEAPRRAGREGPTVSAGFRERFGPVTAYGETSDAEAFAEAFALFHLDPEALERVSSEARTWFASGGHTEPMGP